MRPKNSGDLPKFAQLVSTIMHNNVATMYTLRTYYTPMKYLDHQRYKIDVNTEVQKFCDFAHVIHLMSNRGTI